MLVGLLDRFINFIYGSGINWKIEILMAEIAGEFKKWLMSEHTQWFLIK